MARKPMRDNGKFYAWALRRISSWNQLNQLAYLYNQNSKLPETYNVNYEIKCRNECRKKRDKITPDVLGFSSMLDAIDHATKHNQYSNIYPWDKELG